MCSKRAGDLAGPNPTGRSKRGTKYYVAVTGDGIPVACTATAANVNDTLVFERLFLAAFAVMDPAANGFAVSATSSFGEIVTVFAGRGVGCRRQS